MEPDRLPHDRPAACMSRSKYSSKTFVSLRFRSVKETFGVILKNLIILVYFNFLGAFTNLRKVTIIFVMSVPRLSLCMQQIGFYWTDFREI
jgi:hypothetical protein